MRTFEQIKAHYQIERELADQLRKASVMDRRELYSSLYDELFRRVPELVTLDQDSVINRCNAGNEGDQEMAKPGYSFYGDWPRRLQNID